MNQNPSRREFYSNLRYRFAAIPHPCAAHRFNRGSQVVARKCAAGGARPALPGFSDRQRPSAGRPDADCQNIAVQKPTIVKGCSELWSTCSWQLNVNERCYFDLTVIEMCEGNASEK